MRKECPNKGRIFYKCPDRNVSYFVAFDDYGKFILIFMMIVIKVLIFCFNFSGMALDVQAGTGRNSMLNTCKTLLHRQLRRLMRQ